MNKIAIIVPTRKGSKRVLNKNTKTFANVEGGLLSIKLSQLCRLENVSVYLSTNDPESIEVVKGFDRVTVLKRPNHLCLDTTVLTDLIKYIPTVIEEEHILWTHVTSPMVNTKEYQEAIELYFDSLSNGFDSLMSVEKIQEFIWSEKDKELINSSESNLRWPRTQDLEPLHIVNNAIFIASRKIYELEDRVGENPFLMKMNSMLSMDVDWEDDFKIAEVLYEKFIK